MTDNIRFYTASMDRKMQKENRYYERAGLSIMTLINNYAKSFSCY